MLDAVPPIALVATTDGAHVRRFYESVLGLHFMSEDDFAPVFELQGLQLRFQKAPLDADGVWTSPSGAKVAWLKDDPDGNLLSLTEIPRG